MQVINGTTISEVKTIIPDIHSDSRGYFFESFNNEQFRKLVCNTVFVQDNESRSSEGTLRGLHWQKPPYAQSKLVRVVKGAVFDVAVDIRKGSPTFGKYESAILTEDNHHQFFIPRGFAHGFVALSNDVVFQYKCDNLYNKASESAIAWNSIDIPWPTPLTGEYNLSDKDKNHPTLDNIDSNELFDYNINYYNN